MRVVRLFIFLGGFVLFSCATISQKSTKGVRVCANVDSARVYIDESEDYYLTPEIVMLERSDKDVTLTVGTDSLQGGVVLKSRLSGAFWIGNVFSPISLLGHLIDLQSPKRFTYPSLVYAQFNQEHNRVKFFYWIPPVKGQVVWEGTALGINQFYLNRGDKYGAYRGLLGAATGLKYYFSDKNSIGVEIGLISDFPAPMPAPVDWGAEYHFTTSKIGGLQLGIDRDRMTLGCGLQANFLDHGSSELVESGQGAIDTLRYSVTSNNLGLSLSAGYRLSNGVSLRLRYYPSFITGNDKRWKSHYSHLMRLELVAVETLFRPVGDRVELRPNRRD